MKKKLVLENGMEFLGYGFGEVGVETIGELIFNTSMVGYQEIITDPSYAGQIVIFTYPLIGNYGINDEDFESMQISLNGVIVAEQTEEYSHYNGEKSLSEYLKSSKVVGLEGIDTRKLTHYLRENGSVPGMICDEDVSVEYAKEKLRNWKISKDIVKEVSTVKPYRYENLGKTKIVAIDCGIKLNIIRMLEKEGFDIVLLPYTATKKEVLSYNPQGIFLSNGPGNPEDVPTVQQLVKEIDGEIPIFGICLGHQIIGLSYGCRVEKLKFGHHGANHPVKNLEKNKIEMTSQNHSYAIVNESVENTDLEITHINLHDDSVEGLRHKTKPIFSVQYHPESAPGPMDSSYLFKEFKKMVEGENNV